MDIFQITGSHLRDIRKRTTAEVSETRDSFIDCLQSKYVNVIAHEPILFAVPCRIQESHGYLSIRHSIHLMARNLFWQLLRVIYRRHVSFGPRSRALRRRMWFNEVVLWNYSKWKEHRTIWQEPILRQSQIHPLLHLLPSPILRKHPLVIRFSKSFFHLVVFKIWCVLIWRRALQTLQLQFVI